MLQEPPCFKTIFGCNSGQLGDSGASSSDGTNWSLTPYSYSSSSRSYALQHSRSSLGFSSGEDSSVSIPKFSWSMGSAASSARNLFGLSKEKLASYTITAKNMTSDWLRGVKIYHGPLPFGSIFDPSRSSRECVQVGTSVECTADLASGQSKPFILAYKVSNSMSCVMAKELQTAKTVVGQVTGKTASGSTEPVMTSVSCTMQNAPVSGSGNGLDTSGGAGGASESAAAAGTGTGTQKIASYSVTAQNITNAPIKGAKMTHGPVPAGFVFDPSRSTSGCVQVGENVECTTDLAPGETKPMTIAYKVSDTTDCSAAPSLLTAKASAYSQVQGGIDPVRATVNCTVQTVQKTATEPVAEQAVLQGAGRGNSSYDGTMPRTGTEMAYFMPVRNTIQLIPASPHEQGLDVSPTLSIGLASTLMIVLIFSAIFLQKNAKRTQI